MADPGRAKIRLGVKLLLVILIVTLVPSWTYSQVLKVESQTSSVGSVVLVSVTLTEGGEIAGLQFDLNYDSAVLSFPEGASVIAGTLIDEQSVLASQATPGIVSIAVASVDGLRAGEGSVVLIPLEIGSQVTPGTQTILNLTNILASNPFGIAVDLTPDFGILSIGGPCIGDANLDNVQSVGDAVLILNVIVRKQSLAGQALINADVNEDGLISVEDVVVLLNHLVGKVPLPTCS